MNSTNWPAPDVWVFTAQMVEHCSANAEAMGSNPIEVPKFFFFGGGGGLFAAGYKIASTNATIILSLKICISTVHIVFKIK